MKLNLYSGSRLKMAEAMWPAYYEARLRLAGATATITPFGDPLHGKPDATTFKSVGDRQVVWTPAGGTLDTWDTPMDLRQDSSWRGIIPILEFNGTDEWITTPDAGFWTDTAGSSEPSYTWIFWIENPNIANDQVIWSKSTSLSEEGQDWILYTDGNVDNIAGFSIDDSVNASRGRKVGSVTKAMKHVAITKTTGTTTAAWDIYINGVLSDDTDVSAGTYVQQENGTGDVRLGAENDGGRPLKAILAGGPLGPLFIPGTVMAVDLVKRDLELGRRALAL